MTDRRRSKRLAPAAPAVLGVALVLISCATVTEGDGTDASASETFQRDHSPMAGSQQGDLIAGIHVGWYELMYDAAGRANA